jgi:acylphosphatase
MPTVHLLIKGKVQGVFYRATARDMAEELGIKGWVRNTEEGHVEAVASGPQEKLDQFIQWCRKGPSQAVVTDVIFTPAEEENFREFKVIRG